MVGPYTLEEVGAAQAKLVESCTDSCLSLKNTFEAELDPLVKQVSSRCEFSRIKAVAREAVGPVGTTAADLDRRARFSARRRAVRQPAPNCRSRAAAPEEVAEKAQGRGAAAAADAI